MEELEIDAPLREMGKFKCFSDVERKISALFICRHNGPFKLNSEEISEGEFISTEELKRILERGEKVR